MLPRCSATPQEKQGYETPPPLHLHIPPRMAGYAAALVRAIEEDEMTWFYIFSGIALLNLLFVINSVRVENEWWLIAISLFASAFSTALAVIARSINIQKRN